MKRHRGAALMVMLMIVGVLGAFFAIRALNAMSAGRDKATAAALAQAKDALIGAAVMYRDTHPNEAPGHMLLPDLGTSRNNNLTPDEGRSAANFLLNATNLSALGRFPWRTLGLPVLRDGQGECLWLLVSGSYQDAQKPRFMNWDTLGQLDVFSSNGTPVGTVSRVGTNDHQRPIAAVFAPGAVLTGQVRGTIGADVVTECGGNYRPRNYLDTFVANPAVNNILNYLVNANFTTGSYTYAAPKQIVAGPVSDASGNPLVNDRMLTITPDELFTVIRRRGDFGLFVNSDLLAIAAANLSAPPNPPAVAPRPLTIDFNPVPPVDPLNPAPVDLPGVISVGPLEIGRLPTVAATLTPLTRWQDNLLYARCAAGTNCLTLNSSTPPLTTLSCSGVVIFPGARAPGQLRATDLQKNTWNNYLEGAVLTAFTSGGTVFSGPTAYDNAAPEADVLACVAPNPGTVQVSFAADIGSFVTVGPGVATVPSARTVRFSDAPGSGGGCLWSPVRLGLAGKTVRAYYEFAFSTSDTFALTGSGTDRGNGFTLSFVRGDIPASPPTMPATFAAPNTCGTEARMGALAAADVWGGDAFIVETDVHRDVPTFNDPPENHTAIMLNGNIDHTGPTDTISAACDGSAAGCRHAPANTFEESPPQARNQRLEVHTGCNATCTRCSAATHVAPTLFAQVNAWIDCKDCANVAADLLGAELILAPDDRDFTGGGSWSGVNWSVASGVFSHTVGANAATLPNSALSGPPAIGAAYQVTFTASTITSGTLSVSLGGVSMPAISLSSGPAKTYSVRLTAASSGALSFAPDGSWIGSIDNVSIKPVSVPSISRCVALNPAMNNVFFGLTGGFRSPAVARQGVSVTNLVVRSE